MKIALLFEFATLNGGERSMLAALDWFRHQNSQLEFVAIGPSIGRLADAMRERQITLLDWSPFDDAGQRVPNEQLETSLRQIVANLRPQLLHANSLSMGRLAGRMARQLETPTTTHLRDIVTLSAAAIADLNTNHRLIAVSKATRDFHVAQGVDDARTVVVRNGIDLDQFQPRPSSGRLHAELQLPLSSDMYGQTRPPKLIATIGQIGLRKGQDILVAAAPAIVQQVPEAHFIFIGERTSRKNESLEFERAIHCGFNAAGLSKRLHMLGHRDDVPSLLNEIDVLVHPANQEPFGRVLLEASASGVPIVATDVGGTREIIDDQVTGYLVPPRDSRSLADAVVRILTDGDESDRLRHDARKRAEREFSIAIAAQNLADIWKDVSKI